MAANKLRTFVSIAILTVFLTFNYAFSQESEIKKGLKVGGGIITVANKTADDFDNGFGFGGGAFVEYPIGYLTLHPEIYFGYRQPLSISEYGLKIKITEFALEIPVLLKFSISRTYFEVGPQLAIIFGSKMEVDDEEENILNDYSFDSRSVLEFGPTAGLGFNINEYISIDTRFNYILTDFEDIGGVTLCQIQFGLNFYI